VRRFAPAADPALLPASFVLSGIGLAFVTRLDPGLAATRSSGSLWQWRPLVATLALVPSLEHLAQVQVHDHARAGLVLLVLPGLIGTEVNGARLWIRVAGFSFQPGEIARIAIIVFLAAYLAENREMLSVSTRKILGLRSAGAAHLGPLVLMWALSLFVLVFQRDLGASLLLFGIFLVMIYTATGRPGYVMIGLVRCSRQAQLRRGAVRRTCRRASTSGSTPSPTPPAEATSSFSRCSRWPPAG
jgi:cell division protein FtsW (lipid II flippase)